MITRLVYCLSMACQHKERLATIAASQKLAVKSLIELSPAGLIEAGVAVLVLDFDGVMAEHAATQPCAEVSQWLKACCVSFPTGKLFILSNRPTVTRRAWFQQYFPEIIFIEGSRKKPYPDGLQAIARQSNTSLKNIILIDDRLLTGILAACIAGTRCIYIRKAYRNIWQRPIRECFFLILRALEKGYFHWLAKSH